jgi:hypothetical protein
MYDYEADILVSHEQSIDVLESLVDLSSDVPKLKRTSYIKTKMREDAMVYSEAVFLSNDT